MAGLFASGHAVDIVLLVIAIEAIWLRLTARWHWATLLCRLMPGVMMLMALRAALTGGGWPVVALLLALSFPFHLADLRYGQGVRA
ncbi:MAG: hypothetical protein K2Y20_09620 [Sphingomonas sp.]|nr:hypothetical protein [Sphingomonas sp.]